MESVEYRTRNKTAKILMAAASFLFCVCGIGYFAFSLMNGRKANAASQGAGNIGDLTGIGGFSKTRAVKVEGNIKTTFKDVAGLEQAKLEI